MEVSFGERSDHGIEADSRHVILPSIKLSLFKEDNVVEKASFKAVEAKPMKSAKQVKAKVKRKAGKVKVESV